MDSNKTLIVGSLTLSLVAALIWNSNLLESRNHSLEQSNSQSPMKHSASYRHEAELQKNLSSKSQDQSLQSEKRKSKQLANSPLRTDFYQLYFKKELLKDPVIAGVYERVKQILPNNHVSDLVAMYFAEAASPSDSIGVNYFHGSLGEQIGKYSYEIHSELLNLHSRIVQDPFAHQMAINLTRQLDIPAEKKAEIFGRSIASEMTFVNKSTVSAESSNLTVAFIQMKNSGVTAEMARPYIEQGIQMNQHNSFALAEYVARAKTYYPELW